MRGTPDIADGRQILQRVQNNLWDLHHPIPVLRDWLLTRHVS